MKEQLISFETAKLAKEKGFNHIGSYIFIDNKLKNIHKNKEAKALMTQVILGIEEDTNLYLSPTQSLLQKWLREEHRIEIWLGKGDVNGDKYHCEDITLNNILFIEDSEMFNTYEEALEKGLQEALKIIKI